MDYLEKRIKFQQELFNYVAARECIVDGCKHTKVWSGLCDTHLIQNTAEYQDWQNFTECQNDLAAEAKWRHDLEVADRRDWRE